MAIRKKIVKVDRDWLRRMADSLAIAADCMERGEKVFGSIPPAEAIRNIAAVLRERAES